MIIELAGCHQPQADNNKYEELALVRAVPVTNDGAIIPPLPLLAPFTTDDSSQPNLENPYHVAADEISAIRNVWYTISCTIKPHLLLIDDEIVTMCFID